MNAYITGTTIKELREKARMTQGELADRIGVTAKAVSKWETKKGLPDISLIEPLAEALRVSVMELLSGECRTNQNRSANMKRSKFYVCPVCGNLIHTMGEALVSCCGISLPPLEEETEEEGHRLICERIENEYYVRIDHEMTKEHYISFFAYVTDESCELIKKYPQEAADGYFAMRGRGRIYAYCNHHGFFSVPTPSAR